MSCDTRGRWKSVKYPGMVARTQEAHVEVDESSTAGRV
jgi:hypothetical protein